MAKWLNGYMVTWLTGDVTALTCNHYFLSLCGSVFWLILAIKRLTSLYICATILLFSLNMSFVAMESEKQGEFGSLYQQIYAEMHKASKILLISHARPDGDTIGCNVALKLALRDQLNKYVVSACIDRIPDVFRFLPESEAFVQDFDLQSFDLVISVDVAAKVLLKFDELKPDLLSGNPPLINIDHHSSNDRFGQINLVDEGAAAVAVTIYNFLVSQGFSITPQIATSLLTGIYYDTGGLKHSNTDRACFKISSELLKKGASLPLIALKLFKNMPLNKLRLWGRILETMQMTDQKVVLSTISNKDFLETETEPEDLSGIVEYLNMIPDGKFCVMLSETDAGKVKGSLRTLRDDVDVAQIAEQYGGGGHKQASGFVMEGKLQPEVRWKVVQDDGTATYLDFQPVENREYTAQNSKLQNTNSK